VARNAEIQIGELSRRTGCHVETIRYYERIGLLPHPLRSASRYRLYDARDVRRLTFVRRARELGFTLDDVRVLLTLSRDGSEDPCGEVRKLAADHLVEVRAKIADLHAMERVLSDAVRRCDSGEPTDCPLIGRSPRRDAETATSDTAHRNRIPRRQNLL
jgi:MerR family transcriptional regulator, mercuric resistance operon regulatory protein